MVRPLPPGLDTVSVPECLTVTGIVSSHGCRLRAVLASSQSAASRLPSGPAAAIGTLVHRTVEKWAAGTSEHETPDKLFTEEYAALVAELESDPDRRHFANLSGTRSPSQWSLLRSQVVAQCSALLPLRKAGGAPKGPADALRVGSEVTLESADLRIRGRADRLDKDADGWIVRDYKTGSATTPEGELRTDYAMQLQCYGVMVATRSPKSNIRLIIDDGEEHEVPFDGPARDEARKFIEDFVERIPADGGSVHAPSLATPGLGCSACAYRLVCTAYRGIAPEWWHEYPSGIDRIPFDTSGTVVEISHGQETSVLLEDNAGRMVRVDRLDLRLGLVDVRKGDGLSVFSVLPVGAVFGFNGHRFHPRNFYELPRDRRENRAWEAAAFAHPF
jgi:PD-(D/E)XK nuclease superfamily